MHIRLITEFPKPISNDIGAIMDSIENGVLGRLNRCINRNIMSYDADAEPGDLSHKLMEVTNDNNLACGQISLIEVGECLDKAFIEDECTLPFKKLHIAIFTYENGASMIGAF